MIARLTGLPGRCTVPRSVPTTTETAIFRRHRIEQRTGRSLTQPLDVAEVYLAFEVHSRPM